MPTTGSRPGWGWAALAAAILFALDQGSGGMAFYRDRFYYWLPQYDACRQALAEGQVPLWNPFLNAGQPLLATWQIALGSPLALPFLIWPFATGLKIFWMLALGVAAGGMFALARRAGLSPFAAAVAAVLYAGSGPIRTLGEWPNIVAGLALLPLSPLAADLAATRAAGGRSALALLTGLLVLSGQPRTVALAVLLTGAWLLLKYGLQRGVWMRMAGPVSIGLAIAAIQLFPTIDLYLQSSRRAQGIPWSTVDESFLHWQDLFTLLSPRALGTEHLFRGPGRHLMPRLYLGLAGLWLLWRGWRAGGFPRRLATWLVPATLVIALGSPLYAALLRQFESEARLRYLGHAVLACWPAVCLLAGAGAARLHGRRALAVFTIVCTDLLWSLHGYEVKTSPTRLMEPAHLAAARIPRGRIFSPIWLQQVYDDTAGVPIADRYAARAALLAPNLPQCGGLVNVSGYEPFSLATHAELFAGWEPRDRKPLSAALQVTGARWMTGPKEEALPGWTLRAEPFPAWGLWENSDPGPVASLLPLEATRVSWRSLAALPAYGRVRIDAATWSGMAITVPARPRETCLSLGIPWCRGWSAFGMARRPGDSRGWIAQSAGRRLAVVHSGGILLGVVIPPGMTAISLQYAPISFALGLWVSLLALGALLGSGFMGKSTPALHR